MDVDSLYFKGPQSRVSACYYSTAQHSTAPVGKRLGQSSYRMRVRYYSPIASSDPVPAFRELDFASDIVIATTISHRPVLFGPTKSSAQVGVFLLARIIITEMDGGGASADLLPKETVRHCKKCSSYLSRSMPGDFVAFVVDFSLP